MADDFDLQITQRGDIYTVSGKSAIELYAKLKRIPPAAQTLKIGSFRNGMFTFRKIESIHIQTLHVNAPKIAASGA